MPVRIHPTRWLALVCITVAAVIWTGHALSEHQTALGRGVFLVASEQVKDPHFHHAVVLLTDYGERGAFGLMINRPTDMQLGQKIPGRSKPLVLAETVYRGGPVLPRAVFVLARSNRKHANLKPVLKDLYFAAGVDALSHIAGRLGPNEAIHAYMGHSGWAPGQLESEVARGDWLVVPGDGVLVFAKEPKRIWTELMRRWSGQWV